MFRVFALAVLALLASLEGGGVMFASKQIYLGRSAKAAWRNPYVTDGLVAQRQQLVHGWHLERDWAKDEPFAVENRSRQLWV